MDLKLDLRRGTTPLIMKASLGLVARSYTLRCDAKQAENRFHLFEEFTRSVEHFYLGDYLPGPGVRGIQPRYLETLEPEGVPVISTIAIQDLVIRTEECRFISQEDFDALEEERKLKFGDVILTLDGGTSIGKPALFELEEDYTVDSHVAILRPVGLNPRWLVYLLASPLSQLQFQQAESGASGQTTVNEDELRRFRFPWVPEAEIARLVQMLDEGRTEISKRIAEARVQEEDLWVAFEDSLTRAARRA